MGPKNAKRLSKLSLGSVSLGKNLSCRPLWIIFPTLWDLKGFSSFHHSPPECLPYGPQLALSYQKAYSDSRPVFFSQRQTQPRAFPGALRRHPRTTSRKERPVPSQGAARCLTQLGFCKEQRGCFSAWGRMQHTDHCGNRSYGPQWLKTLYAIGWSNK